MNGHYTSLMILITCLGAVGDSFLKASASGKGAKIPCFIAACCIYCCTITVWYFIMKKVDLSTLGPLYAVISISVLFVIGTILFKEQISLQKIVGMVFALIAIYIMSAR